MQRHRKNIFIALLLLAVLVIFFIINKAEANRTLKAKWINDYIEGIDLITSKNKILEIVLKDINYSQWNDKKDSIDLNINKVDLLGDSKEELMMYISFTPKKSIIAVYQEDEEGDYKYLDLVDEFFDIKDIQLISIGSKGKKLIVVREFVDQMLGAFEKGTYIRAYLWENGQFDMVLSLIEDYLAYWNEMWDNPQKLDPLWLKVEEKSTIKWENGPYPVIRVLENQFYYKSKMANIKELPKEDDFQLISSKEVLQTYYWNEKYQHFVLAEGKDIKTGEKVAIIEDLSLNPFQLAGFEQNQYRIKRENGKIETVPKKQITKINNPLRNSEDCFASLVILYIII
ncbi:MAG TPA: hypothetical protein PKK61_00145 [Defluviitaleaceae bacterium]|jgi:hypothetical protein|nr:hypothetical protein [Candidatus Epulonipiscium sp.]HOA79461.1 hypothetical protein [Defluviitaleaceae bacterium]